MHAGVGQTLALLADIEVPGGTRVRQAGDDFAQIMHAAQQDARLIAGTGDRIAKHLGVAPQSLQEPDERIVPPGHHVGQHQLLFVRQCESRLQPRRIRGLDNRGLVGEHVQPGFERSYDPIDLAAVAAREDGDPAGRLIPHPIEKIGAGMDVQPPIGSRLRSPVVPGDPAQVVDQVRTERRINPHDRR
jgi:hypothetical protein